MRFVGKKNHFMGKKINSLTKILVDNLFELFYRKDAVADKRRELPFYIREVDVLLHERAERIGIGLGINLTDLLHHQFHLLAHIALLEVEEQAGR